MLSLTRWNPFDEMTSLHREIDRVFGRSWRSIPAETDGPGCQLPR